MAQQGKDAHAASHATTAIATSQANSKPSGKPKDAATNRASASQILAGAKDVSCFCVLLVFNGPMHFATHACLLVEWHLIVVSASIPFLVFPFSCSNPKRFHLQTRPSGGEPYSMEYSSDRVCTRCDLGVHSTAFCRRWAEQRFSLLLARYLTFAGCHFPPLFSLVVCSR